MANRVTTAQGNLAGLIEGYLAQQWLAQNPDNGLGANPLPPDLRKKAEEAAASGSITAADLAPTLMGGAANPDGSVSYDADTSSDWSGNLMLALALLAAGGASGWAPAAGVAAAPGAAASTAVAAPAVSAGEAALGSGLKVGAGGANGLSLTAPVVGNAAVGGLGTGLTGPGVTAAGNALGSTLLNAGAFIPSVANAGALISPELVMPLAGLANAAGGLGLSEAAGAASLAKTALSTLKDYAPLLSAGATLLGSAAALNAAKSPGAAGTGTTLTADSREATQPALAPSGLPTQPASTTSVSPQDPRSPSALDLARRRKLAALGGEGSTLLTGGDGIDSGSLSVGKATLLGQ